MLGLWGTKSVAELTTLVEEMVTLYRAAPNPSDFTELALLIHLGFMDIYTQQQQQNEGESLKSAATVLVEDASFLESIISKQENNPQVRLCLIDVYHRLCAFKLQTTHFWNEGFGVKSVLLESCSYIYIQDALRYCDVCDTATNLLRDIATMHHENDSNVPDYVIQGYTQQSYLKVAEIAAFRAKLGRSVLLALVNAETPLLRLYKSQDLAAVVEAAESIKHAPTDLAALTDNSDYSASLAQHALSPISVNDGSKSEQKSQKPLCYAAGYVESLRAALQVLCAANECDTAADKFEKAIEDFVGSNEKKVVAAASWCDLAETAKGIFVGSARTLLNAVKAIKTNDTAAFSKQALEVVELVHSAEKVVLSKVEEMKSGDDDSKFSLLSLEGIYETISALVTQVLAWSDAVVQVLPTFLPAKKGAAQNPKRKKFAAKSAALPEIKAKAGELTAAIKALAGAIKALLGQMLELPKDAIVPGAAEYLVKGVEPTVEFNSALYTSYRETIQDFITLIDGRIKK